MDAKDEIGADGVIITASSKTNDVISQAAKMSRKRGRIILIGVVGLNINRSEFYEKELTFQVSCSYGPGRYDHQYEQEGIDYPLPYVRWTEKRNFETILDSIAKDRLIIDDLITDKEPLENYKRIYNNMDSGNLIGSILVYSNPGTYQNKTITLKERKFMQQKGIVGIIGAGNFTQMTILPLLKKTQASLKYIASAGGLTGTQCAEKYNINKSTTDYNEILKDDDVDTVVIATQHNSHAKLVIEAINAGKNTFVEKPLALNEKELDQIKLSIQNNPSTNLIVGFNRRFSPHLEKVKKSLGDNAGPINIVATMNAGYISKDHWIHNMKSGGGRLIGEACHLMDVCVFLSQSLISSVCANSMGDFTNIQTDNASILLEFQNGSNAVINYFSNGSKKYSKERVEIFSKDRTWIVDNYQKTTAYGVKNFKTLNSRLDKGHKSQFNYLIDRIQNGGESLIHISEIMNVTQASFAAIESLKTKKWINI